MTGHGSMDCPILLRTKHNQLLDTIVCGTYPGLCDIADAYSLQDGGMSEAGAFNLYLVMNVCYIVGTVGCWTSKSPSPKLMISPDLLPVMYYAGRRTTYTYGFVLMAVWQLIVGVLGFSNSVNATLAIGAIMVVINFTFNCSLGPVCQCHFRLALPPTQTDPRLYNCSRDTGDQASKQDTCARPRSLSHFIDRL